MLHIQSVDWMLCSFTIQAFRSSDTHPQESLRKNRGQQTIDSWLCFLLSCLFLKVRLMWTQPWPFLIWLPLCYAGKSSCNRNCSGAKPKIFIIWSFTEKKKKLLAYDMALPGSLWFLPWHLSFCWHQGGKVSNQNQWKSSILLCCLKKKKSPSLASPS